MKKSLAASPRFLRGATQTPTLFLIVIFLATAFLLATSSNGLAVVPTPCTFCHKRTETMMLPCNSLQYQRHLGHGDTIGACNPTSTAKEPKKTPKGS